MDFNYYLDLLRYNIFVQLGLGLVVLILCACNIRMCYLNINAQSDPTHAQGVPDPRTGPTRARATFYPEKDEEPDSPVYTHTECPNYNKTPCKIYINDKGNRISHI
jgi:hypothetical protein